MTVQQIDQQASVVFENDSTVRHGSPRIDGSKYEARVSGAFVDSVHDDERASSALSIKRI